MANPIVQFVDQPAATATVRYDFSQIAANYRALPLGADAIDFGKPTFDGEPEGVGGRYGYRQIQFTQRVIGTRAVALARMSVLAKELLRATNWLRFQWDPSATPVYFKTYRAEPGTLSLENAGQADAWDIIVPLIADPFGYGPRQTISTLQVVQSPADLTGPTRTAMRAVLPAIKGDAPAPLRITLTPAATAAAGVNAAWLIGCIQGKASMADTVVDIGTGDGLTAGAGTAAATTDANFFNGSYRAVTVSAGANLLERLSGSMPAVPAGRYKVLVRYEADSNTTVAKPYLFQFGTAPSSSFAATYGTSVSLTVPLSNPTTVVYRGWVDLGDFGLPADIPTPNTTDTLPAPNPAPYFSLKIGTSDATAGAGLRIDALKLIPVGGPTVDSAAVLKATWTRGNPPLNASGVLFTGTFDGDAEAFWLTFSGGLYPSRPALQGGYATADPAAAQNLLVVMALNHGNGFTAATATTTTKDAQVAVDVSYYPRYLHIGDGT